MPEARLRIHVCDDFAVDVRAALPAHLRDGVEVVEYPSDCIGPQARCAEHCERVHAPGAARTTLMAGDREVVVSRAADGADVCALRCHGPSGYPLINREFVEQLVADGAYLLTPGWAHHWQGYLRDQGFDQPLARQYFAEFCSHLVLLDTGTRREAGARLDEMGEFLGLPARRLPCGLDYLRLFLTDLVLNWRLWREADARPGADDRRQAEYAITLDMLGTLAGVTDEDDVVERILDLLTMLFAPGRLRLLTLDRGRPERLRSRPPTDAAGTAAATARLTALGGAYELLDDGFLLRIGDDEARAAVEIAECVMSDRRDDYLNLALTLAGAFDLALANARSYSRLEHARRELLDSEERYRALMDQASDAIVLVDTRGEVLEANVQALRIAGRTREQIVGHTLDGAHGAGFPGAAREGFERAFLEGTASVDGLRVPGPYGLEVVMDAKFTLVEVGGRRIAQGIFRDVTEREQTAQELRALSLEDALTGLRNRRGFAMLAEQELKASARLARPLVLLYADVDGLKPVNDAYGHAAGDALLRESAAVITRSFRDMDIVARVGGDEFAVLQIDSGASAMPGALRRLEEAQAAANAAAGRDWEISLSVGAAVFDPSAPRRLDELVQAADAAMYRVKRERRRRGAGPQGPAAPSP